MPKAAGVRSTKPDRTLMAETQQCLLKHNCLDLRARDLFVDEGLNSLSRIPRTAEHPDIALPSIFFVVCWGRNAQSFHTFPQRLWPGDGGHEGSIASMIEGDAPRQDLTGSR
eukprot:1443380-Rhodomonas_salina.2